MSNRQKIKAGRAVGGGRTMSRMAKASRTLTKEQKLNQAIRTAIGHLHTLLSKQENHPNQQELLVKVRELTELYMLPVLGRGGE